MRQLLIFGSLALLPGVEVTADPPAEWKLPEADGQKWAARIRKALPGPRDKWSVEVRGNEITVRRNKPVMMARWPINGPAGPTPARPSLDGERTILFVFRFGPKMSVDEWDRLAVVNAASDKEEDRLEEAFHIHRSKGKIVARTPEEKERLRAFQAAVAKLPRHSLPDLYTPDHSVYFLHSGDWLTFPADKVVAAECQDVQNTLLRLFGWYNLHAAGGGTEVGRYLPEPRR
jgi:hypothetical protein